MVISLTDLITQTSYPSAHRSRYLARRLHDPALHTCNRNRNRNHNHNHNYIAMPRQRERNTSVRSSYRGREP